ncbi:Transcriptase [Rhynchospora pubera]|uniref:Transcriptase n=1 Tax=Rhynchospora pubera TaxID=906938 RepID=A0AAV8DJ37_9POAL|nr:Transcriptase [Rhynchospora pubera]
MSVAEMRMLRWICGHTRKDRIRNDDIRDMVGVAPIEEKLIQHRLRWFGHIQRRPPEAPVRIGILNHFENTRSGRGRPKLTWEEAVKRDLKEWNVSKELAIDRSAWKLAIHVPEP